MERDWERAHARRVQLLAEASRLAGREVGESVARSAFDAAWAHHMQQWARGVATGAPEVAERALRLLGHTNPAPQLEALVRIWEESAHSGRVEAVPGAQQTLEALGGAGLRGGLICDTGLTPGRVVRRHLDAAGLLKHLEVCVFSDEAGVPKPDPRVFRTALTALDASPAQAAHVGDLRRTDVAGARGVGMATIRLRALYDDASALPEADAVADSHADVRRLLGL